MTINVPLTPQLEQFVREQLAGGCFHSQEEVIAAALRLLKEQSTSQVSLTAKSDRRGDPAETSASQRSARGILADLPSGITADELREARHEMWAGLHGHG